MCNLDQLYYIVCTQGKYSLHRIDFKKKCAPPCVLAIPRLHTLKVLPLAWEGVLPLAGR